MKFRLIRYFFYVLIMIYLPCLAMAEDFELFKAEYMGTSTHYGRETHIIFKHSDYVNYGSRQFKIFTGRSIADSWRMEYEFVYARVREHSSTLKKDEILLGFQVGLLYDFFRSEHLIFYCGISPGMGYIRRAAGYDELADKSPFFLGDAKLGIDYKVNKNYFVRAQYGIWHVSSIFSNDQGHNNWDYSIQIGYCF